MNGVRAVVASFAVIILLNAYLYRRGEGSYVRIHDNLDSALPVMSLLAQSDIFTAGSDAIFPQILGGLPRHCLVSHLSLSILPYRYLPLFDAFVLVQVLAQCAAYLAMLVLLKSHILRGQPNWMVHGVAVCFGLLPVYGPAFLSVGALPLLFYALLNLRNGEHYLRSWAVFAAYPFVSTFVYTGFFLIPLLALYMFGRWVASRRFPVAILLGLLLLVVAYVIVDYRLFSRVLFPSDYVSFRADPAYSAVGPCMGFFSALAVARNCLFFDMAHQYAFGCQYPLIMLAAIMATSIALLKTPSGNVCRPIVCWQRFKVPADAVRPLVICGLAAACAATSLWLGLCQWELSARLIHAILPRSCAMLGIQRVCWINPFLWGLCFALAVDEVHRRFHGGRIMAGGLICAQALLAWTTTAYLDRDDGVTFREYYSTAMFQEIRDYIGQPQSEYRIACLNIHEGVPLYNGFYLAGGYNPNYPLEFKRKFRRVISPELAKSESYEKLFDQWGPSCNLFSAELGPGIKFGPRIRYDGLGNQQLAIEHLNIDVKALADLGARYIFSSVRIGNAAELGLRLEKVFERPDSCWRIFLYAVPSAATTGKTERSTE